ncbi:hypothetical protein D3C86_1627430 [compost metagenome]
MQGGAVGAGDFVQLHVTQSREYVLLQIGADLTQGGVGQPFIDFGLKPAIRRYAECPGFGSYSGSLGGELLFLWVNTVAD